MRSSLTSPTATDSKDTNASYSQSNSSSKYLPTL